MGAELKQRLYVEAIELQNAHFVQQISHLVLKAGYLQDRERRVVRVFWRVRRAFDGGTWNFERRSDAFTNNQVLRGKVYKVTVRRRKIV